MGKPEGEARAHIKSPSLWTERYLGTQGVKMISYAYCFK